MTQMTININGVDVVKTIKGKIIYHLPIGMSGVRFLKWKTKNKAELDAFKAKPFVETLRKLTDSFSIIDCLGGTLSGEYKKDVKEAKKRCKATFSSEDYQYAYQMQMQP